MPSVVQLFVNPDAGSASRRRLAALIAAFGAAGARVILSESRIAPPAIDPDATLVCAVGGDGTLRHVAAAVTRAGRPLTLGIYPSGTVNLIAREAAYPRDPAAFVARMLGDAPRRRHHSGLIGAVPVFGCASVGPDSAAVAALSPRLKRLLGRMAYVLAFLGVLARWPRPQLETTADGRTIPCEAVYVAKGRYFAGPWSFAPDASVEDALLHVVALRRARRRDFARFVWTLWRRRPLAGDPNIACFTTADLRIESGDAPPLQADGDIVAHLPVRLAIGPGALSFA
jgi:diacylglycerol kinase (ATP)